MTHPNVAKVRRDARRDWERQFKRSLSIEERIGRSTPWWIVIVAAVFFALSVPHTMVIFDKITPDVGKAAPFGIEFGLLFASFRRRVGKMTISLWILEILLFMTAIIVNGAGSLEAVVRSTQSVQGLSFAVLIHQLPDLPATSQVALVLVPIAALIIPIGTVAAGEGLAALVLERRAGEDHLDTQWKVVAQVVEFEALRDADIAEGNTPNGAAKWAAQITGFDAPQVSIRTRADSVADSRQAANGHHYGRKTDARQRVQRVLRDDPAAANLSVRKLAERAGAGKSIAAEELSAWRERIYSNNGHRNETEDRV